MNKLRIRSADHNKLKDFSLILQKSEHTEQLGTDIVNDNGKEFQLNYIIILCMPLGQVFS